MKKLLKVLLSAVLVCAAVVISSCSAITDGADDEADSSRSAVNYETYTCAPQVYDHVCLGYDNDGKGPITVTEATLKSTLTSKKVYVIGLSGTELIKGQSTGILTDLLSAFNLKNDYYNNVVKVIKENIPSGSNIMLAGHSLGGMIAQQVSADDDIKAGYNVLNVLTFGSPLLSAGSREGTVIRLGDTNDAVPYLSGSLINNTLWAILGLNREDGGYSFASYEAHCESYARTDVWGKYDATGAKNGSKKLILNMDTLTYYQSPTSWE